MLATHTDDVTAAFRSDRGNATCRAVLCLHIGLFRHPLSACQTFVVSSDFALDGGVQDESEGQTIDSVAIIKLLTRLKPRTLAWGILHWL